MSVTITAKQELLKSVPIAVFSPYDYLYIPYSHHILKSAFGTNHYPEIKGKD